MASSSPEATLTLKALSAGDRRAADSLLPLIYEELRLLARVYLAREPSGHTLQPTALVHEAYLRLVDQTLVNVQDRGHFFALAARACRRIVVDRARARKAVKRGGGRKKLELEAAFAVNDRLLTEHVELDEALEELAALDERQASIVELRFYVGLPMNGIAELLGISKSTVEKELRMARVWLEQRVREKLKSS